MLIYQYANKCLIYEFQPGIHIWSHTKPKLKKGWPWWWSCAGFILLTEFIHSVCFVLAGAAGLKIKLAKQINHMMCSLADCCCFFFSLHFIGIFPSFPPFLLKLQLSRHEGPCGPDQMFQAAHFPTLCLMEYSWATRHRSTAQHRAAQTRDHLFIYLFHHPAAWLSDAQQQFNIQEHLLTFLFLWVTHHILSPL